MDHTQSQNALLEALRVAPEVVEELQTTFRLLRMKLQGRPAEHTFPHFMVGTISVSGTPGDVQEIIAGADGIDPFLNHSYPFVAQRLLLPRTAKCGIRIIDRATERELIGTAKDQTGLTGFVDQAFFINYGDESYLPRPLSIFPGGGYEVPPNGGFRVITESGDSANTFQLVIAGYWRLPS